MKKTLFVIAALLFLGPLRAQVTDQGNFLVGTTLGFATSSSKITEGTLNEKGEGPSVRQIHIAPSIGYFLLDDICLGIRMDYTFNQQEQSDLKKTKDSDLLFGPYGRVYFPFGDDLALLLEAGFGFGNSSADVEVDGDPRSISTNLFSVGVGPGFSIISTRAIGLEALLKYNYARSRFDTLVNGVTQETITKTTAFDISLGLHLYFSGFRPVEVIR